MLHSWFFTQGIQGPLFNSGLEIQIGQRDSGGRESNTEGDVCQDDNPGNADSTPSEAKKGGSISATESQSDDATPLRGFGATWGFKELFRGRKFPPDDAEAAFDEGVACEWEISSKKSKKSEKGI